MFIAVQGRRSPAVSEVAVLETVAQVALAVVAQIMRHFPWFPLGAFFIEYWHQRWQSF